SDGIYLWPNDSALRANFTTVYDDFSFLDRRSGRIKKGASKLAKVVDDVKIDGVHGVKLIFKATTDHRGVLVLRGEKLSRMVSDVDPKEEGLKVATARATDGR